MDGDAKQALLESGAAVPAPPPVRGRRPRARWRRCALAFSLAAVLAAGAAAGLAPRASAQDSDDSDDSGGSGLDELMAPPASTFDSAALPFAEVSPEAERAIKAGLRWLDLHQSRESGAWDGDQHRIAVTALAGLAFLSAGSTPTSGDHADNVRRALECIVSGQVRVGRGEHPGMLAPGDDRSMYGHGYALLFLSECYGMTARGAGYQTPLWHSDRALETERLQPALRAAIELSARCQSGDGGWYYEPGDPQDEGSVTITQIQGLRAARNAGIHVPRSVADKAVQYVRDSQDPDGGIRYTVRSGGSTFALTVAGLMVLFQAGDYSSVNVQRATRYIRQRMTTDAERESFFYYTHFYAAQVMFQLGGGDWAEYYPRIRNELLERRNADGSWSSQYGQAYGTAMAVIILSVPYRYLPSLTR